MSERYGELASIRTLRNLLEGWDPDLQPDRFITSYGHSLLELYVRLKARGFPVTIGRRPGAGTRVIVASLEELTHWRDRLAPGPTTRLAFAAIHCPTVVLIRGDVPLTSTAPRYIRTEVMPNKSSITDRIRQITMPLLPQRGLIRRSPERYEQIERVALKCYQNNIPEFVRDPGFAERLRTMGVDLRIDTEADKPLRWHDFHDVDVVLCHRRLHPEFDTDEAYLRKPPTKLINAWCAGVIPIVSPEAGYLELIDEGRDAILASDSEGIVTALQELSNHPAHVRELLDHGKAKAARWTTEAVLDEWQRLLSSELPSSNRIGPMASAAVHAPMMVVRRLRQGARS